MIQIGKINFDCDFEYRIIREEDDDLDNLEFPGDIEEDILDDGEGEE